VTLKLAISRSRPVLYGANLFNNYIYFAVFVLTIKLLLEQIKDKAFTYCAVIGGYL